MGMLEVTEAKILGPCIGCGADWALSLGETRWWLEKIQREGYVWPKRCPDCRQKRRKGHNYERASDHLREICARLDDAELWKVLPRIQKLETRLQRLVERHGEPDEAKGSVEQAAGHTSHIQASA